MYLHLPVAGQEREAEGDRSSGDEDAVEDRQHCQDLSKCQLRKKKYDFVDSDAVAADDDYDI